MSTRSSFAVVVAAVEVLPGSDFDMHDGEAAERYHNVLQSTLAAHGWDDDSYAAALADAVYARRN